jgi:hypothetical protein
MEPDSCESTSGIAISDLTETSVKINWNAISSASFQIEYGITGFTQGEGQIVSTTTNSKSINNLEPNTSYQYYIKTNCGNNNFSDWVGPNNFTTANVPLIAPIPYLMTSIDSDSKLLKWYKNDDAISYTIEFGIAGFTIGNGQTINTIETSAIIDYLNSVGTFELYLKANYQNSQSSDWVGPLNFSTNGSDCGVSNLTIQHYNSPNSFFLNWGETWVTGYSSDSWLIEYGHAGFELGNGQSITPSNNVNALSIENLEFSTDYDIYIKGNCSNSGSSIYTGFITYSTLAACPAPTIFSVSFTSNNLIALSCYSQFANSWDIIYGETGFDINDGTILNSTDSYVAIEGLQANTSYEFYARSHCESDEISDLIGPLEASTTN